MEISEQTILKLVEGQAATTQALADLKDSLDKPVPILLKDIRSVEKKLWYFSGIGTSVAFLVSHAAYKIFGGK